MIVTSATGSAPRLRAHTNTGSWGFSLIELLVVLTIMVLLAGLFPLALEHAIPARKLAAASEQLASTLRELRSIALASGKSASLVPAENSYVTRDANGADTVIELPSDMTLHLLDDSSGRALPDLTFFPDGSSSGGRFEVRYENKHRSVVVTRLMGRVRADG